MSQRLKPTISIDIEHGKSLLEVSDFILCQFSFRHDCAIVCSISITLLLLPLLTDGEIPGPRTVVRGTRILKTVFEKGVRDVPLYYVLRML